MFKVLLYDGGVYRSDELYEMIDDVGGAILQKTRSSQLLSVTMSVPEEDEGMFRELCKDMGGELKSVPLAGTEIAVVGPTLGRHHMPHPICDIAEHLRRQGAITVVMGLARGRGKGTAQINLMERGIIEEYDAAVFSLGNFKSCVEAKTDLFKDISVPVVLVAGPSPDGIDDTCYAIVSGVGRKASRMRSSAEIKKLMEVSSRVEDAIRDRASMIEEDPLYVSPSDVKQVLEGYEPINLCLRPAPIVLHLDGMRVKVGYDEHHEAIEDMTVYGERLGDICRITPSKINDSSMLIRIKSVSEVEYERSLVADKGSKA